MNKEEFIERRGEAAYKKNLQQSRDWHARHHKEHNANSKRWRDANPDKAKANDQKSSCKGGEYYEHALEYKTIGFQGERSRIRAKHRISYRAIKQATPNCVLHHEWIPGTAKYRGVALVDKEAHQNSIIKVIKVLEGQITLFTEKEIAKGGM